MITIIYNIIYNLEYTTPCQGNNTLIIHFMNAFQKVPYYQEDHVQ